jgi:hypothetical protein
MYEPENFVMIFTLGTYLRRDSFVWYDKETEKDGEKNKSKSRKHRRIGIPWSGIEEKSMNQIGCCFFFIEARLTICSIERTYQEHMP